VGCLSARSTPKACQGCSLNAARVLYGCCMRSLVRPAANAYSYIYSNWLSSTAEQPTREPEAHGGLHLHCRVHLLAANLVGCHVSTFGTDGLLGAHSD
jgi:hypothetical protein